MPAIDLLPVAMITDDDWRATAPTPTEADAIGEALRLHEFQLRQLSAGELQRAVAVATTRVHMAGGMVIDARTTEAAP